jgi:hypothetical protein
VTLGDFQITGPHFLFVKMSETQRIRVHGFASMSPSAVRYSAN